MHGFTKKQTNNTPLKKCKADLKHLNCQHEKLSSYSPLPVAPPRVKLTFTSLEAHVLSFCELFAPEMLNQAVEKEGFTCQRQTLAAEGSKHNLPATSIADTSPLQGITIALVTNAHPSGKPNHMLSSFLPLARPLQCVSRIYCSPNVGTETKGIVKSPPQSWLKVAWHRSPWKTFLSSSTAALAPQFSSVTSAVTRTNTVNLISHSEEGFFPITLKAARKTH